MVTRLLAQLLMMHLCFDNAAEIAEYNVNAPEVVTPADVTACSGGR